MDQVAQRAFVESEAVRGVERSCAGPAESAPAFEVQGESILKGSLALRAVVLGRVFCRLAQTGGADGNARVSAQRFIANPAFVWEQERKKGMRNLPWIETRKPRCCFG
jgi:hypothetical protein